MFKQIVLRNYLSQPHRTWGDGLNSRSLFVNQLFRKRKTFSHWQKYLMWGWVFQKPLRDEVKGAARQADLRRLTLYLPPVLWEGKEEQLQALATPLPLCCDLGNRDQCSSAEGQEIPNSSGVPTITFKRKERMKNQVKSEWKEPCVATQLARAFVYQWLHEWMVDEREGLLNWQASEKP